jgi:hypothetical protein
MEPYPVSLIFEDPYLTSLVERTKKQKTKKNLVMVTRESDLIHSDT